MKRIVFFLTFSLNFGLNLPVFGIGFIYCDNIPKPVFKKKNLEYFNGSFKEAIAKAKSEGKMIMIDSYTSWCAPCKQMKNMLENDKKLSNFLDENFVCLSINIEKGEGPKLKRKYPHGTFPTLLFIKSNGQLKNKFVGLPNYGATELLNFARIVLQ